MTESMFARSISRGVCRWCGSGELAGALQAQGDAEVQAGGQDYGARVDEGLMKQGTGATNKAEQDRDYMRIAIDTGGTFTDIVYLQDGKLAALKVFSTPDDPGRAVLEGLRRVGAEAGVVVRHGTTVATNAMLERKGARVAFITTKGFQDTIAIGRQARPKLYDWFQPPPACLVPQELRFGIAERVSAKGDILQQVDEAELERLIESISTAEAGAIAVSLLFSFANQIGRAHV